MKRHITILLLLAFTIVTNAQSHRYYCDVIGAEGSITNGMNIQFDFGNYPVFNAGSITRKQKLVDKDGNEIRFYTMVDASNYLSALGWTFQQAYFSNAGGSERHHWIFYKDAKSVEEMSRGILTKEAYKQSKK